MIELTDDATQPFEQMTGERRDLNGSGLLSFD